MANFSDSTRSAFLHSRATFDGSSLTPRPRSCSTLRLRTRLQHQSRKKPKLHQVRNQKQSRRPQKMTPVLNLRSLIRLSRWSPVLRPLLLPPRQPNLPLAQCRPCLDNAVDEVSAGPQTVGTPLSATSRTIFTFNAFHLRRRTLLNVVVPITTAQLPALLENVLRYDQTTSSASQSLSAVESSMPTHAVMIATSTSQHPPLLLSSKPTFPRCPHQLRHPPRLTTAATW